jgi:peptide/nickel transport system substrate-binding protein
MNPIRPTPACGAFVPLLPLAARDLLSPAEQAHLDEHLAACAFCRAELAALRREDDALRALLAARPPVAPLTAAQIARRLQLPSPVARFARPAALAAALLAVMLVITTVALRHPITGSSPSATSTAQNDTGYDYTYTIVFPAPSQIGGTVTIGDTQAPTGANALDAEINPTRANWTLASALWGGCIMQLPDLELGDNGWKPDGCTEVPTLVNGDESPDGRTTILKIDPNATWSDGQPLTAADYLFAWQLLRDPAIGGGYFAEWPRMAVTVIDARTLRIDWGAPNTLYLASLWLPEPLHIYDAGSYAGVFDPQTDHFDSALAQHLVQDPIFTMPAVSDGPYRLHSLSGGQVDMIPNKHYHSNFFHGPFLDHIIYKVAPDDATLIAAFNAGQLDLAQGLAASDLNALGQVSPYEQIDATGSTMIAVAFNQRATAPNAQMDGGTSIFGGDQGQQIRQAFAQSIDRCAIFATIAPGQPCAGEMNPAPYISVYVPASLIPNAFVQPNPPTFQPVPLPGYAPTTAAATLDTLGLRRDANGWRTFANGQEMQLRLAVPCDASPDLMIYARALAYAWARNLGVQIVTVPVGCPACPASALTATPYDLALVALDANPASIAPYVQTDGAMNSAGVSDPALDALLLQLSAAPPTEGSAYPYSAYQRLANLLNELIAYLPLLNEPDLVLVNDTLNNFKASPLLAGNTWNIGDWFTTG